MKILSAIILTFTMSFLAPAHFAYPYGGGGGGGGGDAGSAASETTRDRKDRPNPPPGYEPKKTVKKQEEKADSGEQTNSAQPPESDSDKEQAEETGSPQKTDEAQESKSDSDAEKMKQTGLDEKKPDTGEDVFGPKLPPGVEDASVLISEMQEGTPKKPVSVPSESSGQAKVETKEDDSLPDYESLKRIPPAERPHRQLTPKERELVGVYMAIRDQLQKAVREGRREHVRVWGERLGNMMIWHPELRDDFEAEPYHKERREEFMRRSSRRHLTQDLAVKQAKEDYYFTYGVTKVAEVSASGAATAGQTIVIGAGSAVVESVYRGDMKEKGARRLIKSVVRDAVTGGLRLKPVASVTAGEVFDRTLGKKIEERSSNVKKRETMRTRYIMNP